MTRVLGCSGAVATNTDHEGFAPPLPAPAFVRANNSPAPGRIKSTHSFWFQKYPHGDKMLNLIRLITIKRLGWIILILGFCALTHG